jgi:sodium-dependent phosphate transporter
MTLGSILEFAGSVGVGARVADTIRTKVVDIDAFENNPPLLMLGMMCAIVGSATWLTFCTRMGLTVSTTHSIMGGVIGMGVALVGANNVIWTDFDGGEISSGVVSVFLAWIIAPGVSAAFAIIIFLITKYAVMLRTNPAFKGLFLVPVYFGFTAALLTMLIVWKGGSIEIPFNDAETAGMIVGVGAAWALLVTVFLVPWLYRIVIKDDWQLRWWHIAMGPLLLKRPEPPVQPHGAPGGIRDFYAGHMTREELDNLRHGDNAPRADDVEAAHIGKETANDQNSSNDSDNAAPVNTVARHVEMPEQKKLVGPKPDGKWSEPKVLFWYVKWLFLRGVDQDIVNMQTKEESVLTGDLAAIHAHVPHYDNKAEYLFTFVQVMTACTASFTHGANDVANAIGPYATIYQIWQSGSLEGSKSTVPIWILCFGGFGIGSTPF